MKTYVEQGVIPYIDLACAEVLLKSVPSPTEEAKALVAYLSAAMRAGHLCCSFEEGQLYPDPSHLWPATDAKAIGALASLIKGGADLPTLPYIHRFGHRYYLQRLWQKEGELVAEIERMLRESPSMRVDCEDVQHKLAESPLLPEQKKAILAALNQTLTLISGGPGTGKTFTAGYLVRLLGEGQPGLKIVLTAPTGKATLHLKKSLSRALPVSCSIEAKTLHSLLRYDKGGEKEMLAADLIIVDECSMIDLALMAELFKAVKPHARLVMFGDCSQLPPVEAGAPFADMVQTLPALLFTQCQRTDLQPLLTFADSIKQGNSSHAQQLLAAGLPALRHRVCESTPKQLLTACLPFFPPPGVSDLALFDQFRLLSPLREGPWGVEALNALFADHFRRQLQPGEPFAAPIMIVKNDWRQELFNGEVGLLVSRRGSKQVEEGDYALFADRRIPALLLPPFEYAYCLSVHKSQGSEFGHVLVVLPPGSERFGRELLYTAVTRARQRVELWGAAQILTATIHSRSHRLSSLSERLACK